jgi:hypothetical protein
MIGGPIVGIDQRPILNMTLVPLWTRLVCRAKSFLESETSGERFIDKLAKADARATATGLFTWLMRVACS